MDSEAGYTHVAGTSAEASAVPPCDPLAASMDAAVVFVVADESGAARQFRPTAAAFTIGRSKAMDFVLSDGSVSREHALVEQTADGWQVTDLGSTNGTSVGGQLLAVQTPTPWPQHLPLRVGSIVVRRAPAAADADGTAVWSAEGADDDIAEQSAEPTHPTADTEPGLSAEALHPNDTDSAHALEIPPQPEAAAEEPSFSLEVQEEWDGDMLICRLWMRSEHADSPPYLVGYEGDGLLIEPYNRDPGTGGHESYWTVLITPERRPRFGRTERFPFELVVVNRRGERQHYAGEYVRRPRMSLSFYALVVPLAAALVAFLTLR